MISFEDYNNAIVKGQDRLYDKFINQLNELYDPELSLKRKTELIERTKRFLSVAYSVLGIAGEAGEIADKLKKILRDKEGIIEKQDWKDIEKEGGDVLWHLSDLSDYMGSSITDVAQVNINKLEKRVENDTLNGSGDER